MNGASVRKSAATAAVQRTEHVELRLRVDACSGCAPRARPHQFLHPADARLHRRVLPRCGELRPGAMTTLSAAGSGAGRPRSKAASFSACQIDSATNGMTGCTSRRMRVEHADQHALRHRPGSLRSRSRPLLISTYQSQNSDQVKS